MAVSKRLSTVTFTLLGVAVAVLMVVLIAPWANPNPDGLEKVGADTGIDAGVLDHHLADSPLADYGLSGVDNRFLATPVAGVIGIAATFAIGAGVVWLVRRRRVEPATATSNG
ncbi:MAG: PDGLE domain-containing protein [Ilumatobacteraceae bacterium]